MPSLRLQPRFTTEASTRTAFLVVDTESVPDGRLLNLVKYPEADLTPDLAIEKAQAEYRENSWNHSDFLPVTFQVPVSVCVVRVGGDFSLQAVATLDAPQYRPREIVKKFWDGLAYYHHAKLVTFNGRAFDMPLMELAAFRYGCQAMDYFQKSRNRYNGGIDLMDWLTNYGAYRLTGGLNLLAKLLGKPGKMGVSGDQVLQMYQNGQHQEINDYCMYDTLDTYFVFLRTRVLTGEIDLELEADLIRKAKEYLVGQSQQLPALGHYLANWTDWPPWP